MPGGGSRHRPRPGRAPHGDAAPQVNTVRLAVPEPATPRGEPRVAGAPTRINDLIDGHVGYLFAPLDGVAIMTSERVLDPPTQLRPVHRISLDRCDGACPASPTSRAHCHQLT